MVKEGYKQTEIGVIPEDWDIKKIKNFTNITTGATPNTRIEKFWGGDIKWMSSGELNQKFIYDVKGRITVEGLKNSSTKLLPKNCILIGLAGQGKTRGTVAINYVKLCTNQSIAAIYPNENYISNYLFYNLEYRYNELRSLSTGDGGRGGLNLTIIRNLDIIFPPKPEQKAIATALSDIDNLINSLEQLIAKKEAIKKATMQQLLTGKKRLKGFSGEWEEKKLEDISKIKMGHSPSSIYYNTKGIGLPLIQGNADIKDRKTIIRNYTSQITRRAYKNDIIMSVRAPVGEISKATFDACIGRGVCAITIKNDFLYHYLIHLEPKWSTISTGSTFDSVTSDEVRSLLIYLPEDDQEQQAIAEILSDMDKEIEVLKSKLDKSKAIKTGMMQELLTGRVRLIKK